MLLFAKVVLIGTSIFEYVHEDDRLELAVKLGIKNFDSSRVECNSPNIFDFSSFENNNCMKFLMDNTTNETVMCSIRFKSVLLKRSLAHKYSGWRVCIACQYSLLFKTTNLF